MKDQTSQKVYVIKISNALLYYTRSLDQAEKCALENNGALTAWSDLEEALKYNDMLRPIAVEKSK